MAAAIAEASSVGSEHGLATRAECDHHRQQAAISGQFPFGTGQHVLIHPTDVLGQSLPLRLQAPRGVEHPDDERPPLVQLPENLQGQPVDRSFDPFHVLGPVPPQLNPGAQGRRRRQEQRRRQRKRVDLKIGIGLGDASTILGENRGASFARTGSSVASRSDSSNSVESIRSRSGKAVSTTAPSIVRETSRPISTPASVIVARITRSSQDLTL